LGWLWLLLRTCQTGATFIIGMVALILACVWIGHRAEKALAKEDPGQIVLDEICAIPVSALVLIFASATFEKTLLNRSMWPWWIAIFALFRLFDIWKPWPVKQIQVLPRGWGLVLDDVLAAGYVNVGLLVIKLLLPFF
jgi:phosphatidylglycerophosphatase A